MNFPFLLLSRIRIDFPTGAAGFHAPIFKGRIVIAATIPGHLFRSGVNPTSFSGMA